MILDIALLPGLRQDTREILRKAGITSIEQIAAMTPDELRKIKGIKSTAEAVHASARAWINNTPVWLNRLPDLCHQGGWMFDIETDPRTGIMWCLGWSDDSGEAQVALVAPQVSKPRRLTLADGRIITLVPDDDWVWRTFADSVGEDDRPIYHWTGFDTGVMRNTAPEEVQESLLWRTHDLHATYKQCVRFPVSSASLKVVAAYLNFAWTGYQAWDAAFNDYNLWLSRDDLYALTRACAYQRDDVVALQVVWRWMIENAAGNA